MKTLILIVVLCNTLVFPLGFLISKNRENIKKKHFDKYSNEAVNIANYR